MKWEELKNLSSIYLYICVCICRICAHALLRLSHIYPAYNDGGIFFGFVFFFLLFFCFPLFLLVFWDPRAIDDPFYGNKTQSYISPHHPVFQRDVGELIAWWQYLLHRVLVQMKRHHWNKNKRVRERWKLLFSLYTIFSFLIFNFVLNF